MQDDHVADVRVAVADLHPAGFTGGLLPFTSVLNGEEGEGERPTANMKREREEGMKVSAKRGRTRRDG